MRIQIWVFFCPPIPEDCWIGLEITAQPCRWDPHKTFYPSPARPSPIFTKATRRVLPPSQALTQPPYSLPLSSADGLVSVSQRNWSCQKERPSPPCPQSNKHHFTPSFKSQKLKYPLLLFQASLGTWDLHPICPPISSGTRTLFHPVPHLCDIFKCPSFPAPAEQPANMLGSFPGWKRTTFSLPEPSHSLPQNKCPSFSTTLPPIHWPWASTAHHGPGTFQAISNFLSSLELNV